MEVYPVIELLGDREIILNVFEPYEEYGFLAYDSEGIDITDDVTVLGTVDIENIGEYELSYSVVDSNNLKTTVTRTVKVILDYFKVFREAVHYKIGDLSKAKGMVDSYVYDRFLFVLPPSNKKTVDIYLYDDSYSLESDFTNATLKVYKNGKWKIKGSWVDVLDSYMLSLAEAIANEKEDLESDYEDWELQLERELEDLIRRFAMLFGMEFVEGYSDIDMVNINRLISTNQNLSEFETIGEFLGFLYGIEVKDVPNRWEEI